MKRLESQIGPNGYKVSFTLLGNFASTKALKQIRAPFLFIKRGLKNLKKT